MATPEPSLYSALSNDRSTWPCVLVYCHVGMSKYVPRAASWRMNANVPSVFFYNILHSSCCIHLAINFDQISCAFLAHTSPKHQRSISVFHSRNSVPFIIGLVDSSPNVAFMVVTKKLHFDLITPNYFVPEGLRLVSVPFGVL